MKFPRNVERPYSRDLRELMFSKRWSDSGHVSLVSVRRSTRRLMDTRHLTGKEIFMYQ